MEDFLYKFLGIYFHLPLSVRQVLGKLYQMIPARIKYGSFYFKYRKRLLHFSTLPDIETIKKESEKLLIEQVNYAIRNIPFYSGYPKMVTASDIRNYPIITKKTLLDNFDACLNPNRLIRRIRANTGGSTGTPLEFYLEKNVSRPKEKAHFDWYWGQFGYKPNAKTLMVRGTPLPNYRDYEHRTIDNVLNVSCYNINENNIVAILGVINAFKPSFIHAYPSSLKVIVSLLESYHAQLPFQIKAMFLGSEHLSTSDRHRFETFFNAPAVNWYGSSERLLHGGNCPCSDEYHFYPAYGFLELLDDKGNAVTCPGEEGRIVATGFDNRVMPFIRYDVGDLGILSETTECSCGFKGVSLKRITGRGQDVIVLSDGTKVSLTALIFGQHLEAFDKIREMQVVQDKVGELEIRIVKNSEFSGKDETNLRKTLAKSVNHKLTIMISYVTEVSKTSRGKNIFFVSRLETLNS